MALSGSSTVVCMMYLLGIFCVVKKAESIALNGPEGPARNGILTFRLASVDVEKKPIVLTKGDTLKLECEFSAESWSYVQWVKLYFSDGFKHSVIPVNRTSTNGSTVVSSVVLDEVSKEDSGNYSCISTTASGATAFEFHVVVKEKLFCEENFCAPHGECAELVNGYLCNCHTRYIGKHCELEDPCLQYPCLNNGSCMTIGEGFNCTCLDGFGGEKCEREICGSASCNGGGSCSETDDGKIKCNCRYDRTGERCQHRCSFSTTRRSSYRRYNCNGRTCVFSENGNERCECHRHSHSNFCMMASDIRNECSDSNICHLRGSCEDFTYQYRCSCNSYASGKNCEFYNECRAGNHACTRNGGTCVDLPVGYKCINCPVGQDGDKCQLKSNPCQVTCSQTSMTANCDTRFLNSKLNTVPIYFNSKACLFDGTNQHSYYHNNYGRQYWTERSKSISYLSCGTEIKYENDFIIYRNTLRSGQPSEKGRDSDIITRISGYFRFDMECRIPLYRNTTSGVLNDISLTINETTDLQNTSDISIPASISYYKENWRSVSKYVVGDRLYVKLYTSRISNTIIKTRGVLNPVTCFATSDRLGESSRYFLLQDGCIKDETFRYEAGPKNAYQLESFFSFDSFAFKNGHGKFYLHCDVRICLRNQAENVNETQSDNCKITCKGDEVTDDTTSVMLTDFNPTTSSQEQLPEPRKKRSLSIFDSLFGIWKEQEIIDRASGSTVNLLKGQAVF